MTKPAVWNDDPDCGHDVACAHQTHYCTYIRVPRLLTLQQPASADELWLITAHQWYALWFKVLQADLQALLVGDGASYEPVKLLRRGIELFRLFDQHADLAETVVVRELGLAAEVRRQPGSPLFKQFEVIRALHRRLPRMRRSHPAELREARRDYNARLKAFRGRYQKFCKATVRPVSGRGPTYAEWLRMPALLDLQTGVKAAWTEVGRQPAALMEPESLSADENMFVIVHQCFELWFKVILDQIDRTVACLQRGDVTEATRCARRAVLIQRLLVPQIQIPATMLPLDFLKFREQRVERDGRVYHTGLSPASGTESYQFREIEIVCGLRDDPVFQTYLAGTDKLPIRLLTPRQRERLEQTTLPEAFSQAVEARGLERLDDLFTAADAPNPHADLAQLADTLIEFDEFFRFWRIGHLTMVEKMIGGRSGTGFLGPEYLMETAGIKIQARNRVFEERQVRPRFFEALWAVRSRLGGY